MTLTIFAITLVPFPVYIAGRNGRGCYSVALNRLQGGAVLKRPGFEIFKIQQASVLRSAPIEGAHQKRFDRMNQKLQIASR